MATEFPKNFFRYDEFGDRIGRTFNSAEDVEEGWVTIEELGDPPKHVKAKPAAAPVAAGDQADVQAENAKLKASVSLHEQQADVASERIATLEDFLKALAGDENAPDQLKADINALFAPVAAPAKPAKPRAKAAA